jgi:16S rRNA G966 N2-methylase RsmD
MEAEMTQVFEDIIVDAEFAALIPPLSAEERQQLEENIVEHGGARDPLVVWASKGTLTLLDGHNRYEICTRLGLPFEIEEMRFDHREDAMLWMIDNQRGRRNLPAIERVRLEFRREEIHRSKTVRGRPKKRQVTEDGGVVSDDSMTVTYEKNRQKSASFSNPDDRKLDAKIGDAAGVSRDTVAKVRKIEKAEAAGKIDTETSAKLRLGEVSINRVVRDLKEQETAARRQEQKAVAISKRQSVDGLYLGDFRKIGDKIPDASVDLIFTDPPYDRKAIELYDGLGEFAARVLRPGGSLVAYVGHIQLPDALTDLSKHLRYWWTCGCFHSEAKARMTEYGIVAGWKPIVWFVKETRGDKQTFVTDVVTGAREKSHHDWQQAVSEARHFIDLLTQPDDFVVDPFCGGGTTPVACIKSGRKWACFEIDEANFSNASSRIKEVMDDQAI